MSWIDVNYSLPTEKQMVTVFGIPKGAKKIMVWGGVVFSNGKFWDFDFISNTRIGGIADFIELNGVTHWQPLPEPPK